MSECTTWTTSLESTYGSGQTKADGRGRNQGVLGMAYDTAAVRQQGVCGWHGYHDVDASGRQLSEAARGAGCAYAGRGRE